MPRLSRVVVVVFLSVSMTSCASSSGRPEPDVLETAWRRDSAALADSLAILLGAHDKGGRNPAAADVDATSFLFALRKASAQASATTLAHIAQRYTQIATALPTVDGLRRNEVDARHDWSSAIGLYDPGSDGDEVVRVVQAEVSLDGAIVRQAYDTTLRGVVSAASCDTHGPVIAYNPRMLAGLAVGSVRFFQQHELAHFALRHVDCGRSPLVDEHYTERAADCWAVGRLEGRVPEGILAIGAATQFFKTLHEPAELPHYESSDSRATYIDDFCRMSRQ